jgi:hypothetical protein
MGHPSTLQGAPHQPAQHAPPGPLVAVRRVPPTNPLNTYRLVLWFLCAVPGIREFYEYIQGQRAAGDIFHKLGAFAWLAIAVGGGWGGWGQEQETQWEAGRCVCPTLAPCPPPLRPPPPSPHFCR